MGKVGLMILVLGLIGAMLGGGTLVVSLLLPSLTDGRTSWEEALIGIISGAIVLTLSLFAAAGLILMAAARRRKPRP